LWPDSEDETRLAIDDVSAASSSWRERIRTMNGYAVIIEGEGDSYSAYVPDLPGCVAAGSNVAEVEVMIRDAIRLHVESLREYGEPVPKPTAAGTTIVEVPSAS
jgi:predicted RNase H-like HicB family nuclease